ncbi:MAG TPA: U32 family peptidase C-terminal domain-containing protein [Pseudobdellovibrionaceae bacterium]|nr:U32 family peptidase C-terminal domain-containing protein [Pseudobdellovibrionaceae bacterium]
MQNLELLMPAGSPRKLELAIEYGADAVYLGPPYFSLRARENDFSAEELTKAINWVHGRGKKVYMTLNIFARNRKLKNFYEALKQYDVMKPDAFIVSDPGLALICKEVAPEIPLHLSVQANCMNWKSVQFWKQSLGIERVILSRELSIQEISEIKQRVPEMELEAFVHGSICIAYSGRCLLSSYMSRRDANQGVCDNSCREKFKLFGDGEVFIEDQRDPGGMYPIEEDEHGTYILNAKDLCMIEHLKELADAGVVSFKVEGRTKSEFYAAMIARAYRGALNDLETGKPFDPQWLHELEKISNRGYHTAFMFEDPSSNGQNYKQSHAHSPLARFVGLVDSESPSGETLVDIKNKMSVGGDVKIIMPDHSMRRLQVRQIMNQKDEMKDAVHSGSGVHRIRFSEDIRIPKNSLILTEANFESPN